MKYSTTAFCLVLMLLSITAKAADISTFRYTKDLSPGPGTQKDIGSITFDDDLYRELDAGFANLRIFDSSRKEVRFLIQTATETSTVTQQKPVPVQTVSFKNLVNNQTEIILQRKSDQPAPDALEIICRQKNYEKLISVFGSNDYSKWIQLASEKPIFDYSKYISVRNNNVQFKSEPYTFYKVIMSNVTEPHVSPLSEITSTQSDNNEISRNETTTIRNETLRIDKIIMRSSRAITKKDTPVIKTYEPTGIKIEDDKENKATVVSFTMGKQPVTEVSIITTSRNFSRRAFLECSPDSQGNKKWRKVSSGQLTHISVAGVRQMKLALPLHSPQRAQRYRLTIENQDSPPLLISGIKARGHVHEALFLAESNANYQVFYGGANIKPPVYDIGKILGVVSRDKIRSYTPLAQTDNPQYTGDAVKSRFSAEKLLAPMLILMSIVLLWFIGKGAKNLDDS